MGLSGGTETQQRPSIARGTLSPAPPAPSRHRPRVCRGRLVPREHSRLRTAARAGRFSPSTRADRGRRSAASRASRRRHGLAGRHTCSSARPWPGARGATHAGPSPPATLASYRNSKAIADVAFLVGAHGSPAAHAGSEPAPASAGPRPGARALPRLAEPWGTSAGSVALPRP